MDQLDRAWTLNNVAMVAMARAIAFIESERPQTAKAVLEVAKEQIEGKRGIPKVEVEDEGGSA